jgi:SAM-dependent methyltransferase
MSFWPFPTTLLAELRAAVRLGPAVEIGAGDGRLATRLHGAGVPVLRADRDGPCDLRLDARALPFGTATLGLVVMGNLLRHLTVPARHAALVEAARVLRSGGVALLLEDHPQGLGGAEVNYRRALDLLAAADPARGTALDLASLLDRNGESSLEVVSAETLPNEERPLRPEVPLDWLAARGGTIASAAEQLRRDVREQGMEYGRFQAVLLRRVRAERPA